MTYAEFAQVLQLLSGTLQPDQPGGLYARWPLNAAAAAVWYKTLAPYPVPHVCAAIEAAYADDPLHLPAPQALIARMHAHGINGAFAVLRAQQQDSDWRACHLALQAEDLHLRGQEAAYIARCQAYAAQFPHDAADWHQEIARAEALRPSSSTPWPTPPPTVGAFTHVSAPRRAGSKG